MVTICITVCIIYSVASYLLIGVLFMLVAFIRDCGNRIINFEGSKTELSSLFFPLMIVTWPKIPCTMLCKLFRRICGRN